MSEEQPLPGIAQQIASLVESFSFREALARLDDPHGGGALRAPLAGLLRARALSGIEKWHASYELLGEVRAMRDLSSVERIEAQVRTARVLRFASPLVDYALDMALAAAKSAVRAGGPAVRFAVDAHVEAALLHARKRCNALATAQLDAAAGLGHGAAFVACARGDVALGFDDRVRAKACFEEALSLDADERSGRLGLARLHTVLGEFDEAAVQLGKLGARPKGDVSVRRARWRLLAAQGRWREVADTLGEILEAVPDGDASRGLMLERASALYRAGDVEAARGAWTSIAASGEDWAQRSSVRMLDRLSNGDARRARLVAFPSVTQLRDHCGPASVELCMRFFGTSADQVAVAREIKHPDGGTPVHRMRAYMDAAGFVTRRIEASLDRLKAILDAGVPVIVEEDYSTTRHVAVAIGYDDRRAILEIQDPMTHEVRETPYEELPKLREFSNDGALVAVPKDRTDLLAKLDAAGAVECAYMTTTDKAWEAFDRDQPEKCDELVDAAIALHEPYELAWVLRFLRARERMDKEPSEANEESLVEVLNRILALWPNDEWPQQFLGRVYAFEGRPADALEAFERARDRDPDDANNWCAIGDQHLALGDDAAARRAFEEALRRDPGHVRSNENLANVALDAGDLSLATMLNACARELAGENPFNHHVHGRILAKHGDLAGAVAAYDRALELAPESTGFVVERAKLLGRARKIDDALASVEKRLEEDPKDTYLLVNLADLALVHDRPDACLAACERLAAVDPETATAPAIAGAALCKKGDLDAGLAALHEALRKRPTYAWAHREIGRALAKAGRHGEAIASFAAACGFSPAPDLTFALADALATAGFAAAAVTYVRKAAHSGALDEDQLLRCAMIVRSAEGANAAHAMLGEIGEKSTREIAVARAHVRFLYEALWAPGAAASVLSRLSELAPEDPFVLANEADDLMDRSPRDEPRGESLFRRAIAIAPELVAPRRLFARQLNQRGRFAEALAVLEPLPADVETMEDRVHALLGLRRDDEARAAIEAYAAAQPEELRAARRSPLDYEVAKIAGRWSEALELAKVIAEQAGEIEDDGELDHWEEERFACLVALGASEEAYALAEAECADAEDKGKLAYAALGANDVELARRLAEEAFEEDDTEDYALTVLARLADLDGDVGRAKELWTTMKASSSWHIHHENLGRLALSEGDLDTARVEIEEAVATGHCCPVALRLRAELRLLEGDAGAARVDAERARACTPLEERDRAEDVGGLLLGLAGDRDAARAAFDAYGAREKASPSDRARQARLRAALGL